MYNLEGIVSRYLSVIIPVLCPCCLAPCYLSLLCCQLCCPILPPLRCCCLSAPHCSSPPHRCPPPCHGDLCCLPLCRSWSSPPPDLANWLPWLPWPLPMCTGSCPQPLSHPSSKPPPVHPPLLSQSPSQYAANLILHL